MARRPNQVSIPNPEFGVDFDASARAMHQSASKGSLMVHEKARFGAAALGKSSKATMFERNTMLKTLKRKIALVAVTVVGASGLAVIAAPAANAVIETVAGTVTPVRVTYSGANTKADAVPAAVLKFKTTAALSDGTTRATLTIISAPKAGAILRIGADATVADRAQSALDTANVSADENNAAAGKLLAGDVAANTEIKLPLDFKNSEAADAPVAGTYSFRLVIVDTTGDDEVTVTGSFTTRGAPSTMTVTQTSSSLLVDGVDTATVTLKDANGNTTQPSSVDSLTLAATAGTISDGGGTTTTTTATELNEGTIDLTYTAANAAGSSTVTVTPNGTLPFLGLTAQTLTYNYSGSISAAAISALSISAPVVPTTAITGTLAAGNRAAIVPQGTAAITITATGAASSKIRLRAVASAGTIDGSAATTVATAKYYNVDTDADGKTTLSVTLAGGALASTATLTVAQVNVANTVVQTGGQDVDIVITQTDREAAAGSVTASPKGSIVAKLGASTPIVVTAKDQFGTALGSGYTIRAYRTGIAAANLLDAQVTNASGVATVTLAPAATTTTSGTSESYVLTYAAPGVALGSATTLTDTVTITYTTTGNATSLAVVVNNAGAVTSNLAAETSAVPATKQAVLPSLVVPYDGTADDVTGTEIYTVSTATPTTSSITAYATLVNAQEGVGVTATTAPANSVTWTAVSDGAFVSTTAAAAKWDAAVKTATVANATEIFLYSTKTGVQKWTATSGGLTREFEAYVYTSQFAHYNISVDSPTLSLDGGDYKVVKVKVTDVFGNPVGTPAAAVSVAATGATLLGGFASSATAATAATTGEASITIIGNTTGGTGTVTFTPASTMVGPWLATGFTKPTNAPDPVKSATVTTTVKAATAAANPAVDAVKTDVTSVKADVKAVSDVVATLSKAVTTVQSSVTELTSSFATQIKSLTDAIAKISRAIAAIQKSLKKK